ncbi:MAG: alpha/beta hydrolase [Gemmatimonadaceae bacterium]
MPHRHALPRGLRAALLFLALAAPLAAQSRAPLVIGETFTLASKALGETRRINVYAARGYSTDTLAPLPVLYMPDGGIAEDFLHVAGILQVSVGNGTMRPTLLVGIENTQRRRDLTGPTDNPEDRKIAKQVGGSAYYRNFLRDELKPYIEAHYRTTKESAIVGESLAGLFVVETFLLEPGLFDTYVAFDPSLWWSDHRLLDSAAERLTSRSNAGKTLWLASSDEWEIAAKTAQLATVLQRGKFPGLAWRYVPMPEETHGTIYHPAALKAFRALFAPAK